MDLPTHDATQCVAKQSDQPLDTLRTGAAVLIETLVRCGVSTVFGYPGGAVLPLYDALHADGRLRHILVRHEQAAVHAAEGYARSTGKVGVVFVTSGPGVANTVSGLLDALADSVPVLCISGQVATNAIGTDAFQECDAMGITRPVTKWSHQIRDIGEIASLCVKALTVAASGRPGPVLLDFPKDIQAKTIGLHEPPNIITGLHRYNPSKRPAHRGSIKEALALLMAAKRPIFYAGGGLVISGEAACAAFASLVRETGAPCTLTLMGLGAFPSSDTQFLGMLGMHGSVEANLAMHHADLVICVGARFDDRVTGKLDGFCPNAKIVHIDIDPASINKIVNADVPIVSDCLDALVALRTALAASGGLRLARLQPWWESIAQWRALRSFHVEPSDEHILPQMLLQSLARRLRGLDPVITTDVGQHQMWAAQHLPIDHPRRFITSGGAGTMGFGLPAAIGAKIAQPDKLVVCVSGDASVLMNIQELSTAKQHGCGVKLIISNNGYMGMVRQWQELNYGGRYSHSYTDALPDFVALAKSFGWRAARVEKPGMLDAAVDKCIGTRGPYLLDVGVAAQTNCFPMIPAGMAHHEIMLSEERWYRA
ncbi:biosynthetic-type acetolactate synthase large subunit [Paraburkholderia jirisanensis]